VTSAAQQSRPVTPLVLVSSRIAVSVDLVLSLRGSEEWLARYMSRLLSHLRHPGPKISREKAALADHYPRRHGAGTK
jgi:hypothetical protein